MNIAHEESNDVIKNNIQYENIQNEQNADISFSGIIKDIGWQSLKAIKWFIIVLITFGLSNIILFIVSLIKYGNRPFGESGFWLLIILFVGLIFTAVAFYCTYKYILIDTLNIAYKYLTPLFKKVCVKIIDKAISGGNKLLGKQDIGSVLNVGSLMVEVYGKKLPKYVRKGVVFILKRVPFSTFLFNMQDELKSEKKDAKALSEKLYFELDSYIINTFLKKNSMRWMFWFLPLNIIIQIGILFYIK